MFNCPEQMHKALVAVPTFNCPSSKRRCTSRDVGWNIQVS